MNIGKLLGKAAKLVADNPGKVKIAAAVLGVGLPAVAVKAIDAAPKVKAIVREIKGKRSQ